MDPQLEEAARDLGASSARGAFWHVTLPLIAPAVVAGAMLAFALSFDDLVVTAFNAGVGSTTLPIFIYSSIKFGVSPQINAISTIIVAVVAIALFIAWRLGRSAASDAFDRPPRRSPPLPSRARSAVVRRPVTRCEMPRRRPPTPPRGRRRAKDRAHRASAQALGDRLGLDRVHPEPTQRVARHLDRQLALPVDGLDLRADRPELGRLLVAVGPDHEVEGGVEGLRPLDDQRADVRVAAGHDHQPRVLDIGALEQLDVGRLAEQGMDAACAERLDLGSLLADHDIGEAAPVERPGDQPSDLAVAAQDRVQPQGRAVVGRLQVGQVAGPPLEQAGHQRVRAQPRLERVHVMEQQRVEGDRQQGARRR